MSQKTKSSNSYDSHIARLLLKDYSFITPVSILLLCVFIYSDIFLLEHPEFVLTRLPLMVVLSILFFVRFFKLRDSNFLIFSLSIMAVMSCIYMGVSLLIKNIDHPTLYRTAISGLIVETFVTFFLIRGKKNIIIAYSLSLMMAVILIALCARPEMVKARELLNPFAIFVAVVLTSLLIEATRKREFLLSRSLNVEKDKSDQLYSETLVQNGELESQKEELLQQKEEILSINETLEQQTEELQVNLEVISELNGSLKKKNKAITDSINYARRIQEAILPSRDYISKLFHDSFILFKPCDIVSGDFYWFKETPNYKIVAAVDCTGHGIPGAFMSMLGYSLLNEITEYGNIKNANVILNQLKVKLKEALNQSDEIGALSDGLDIALCMIDIDNKHLQFAGAYMPLCIIRDEEVIGIKGDRMPIGRYVKEIDSFTNHEVEIFDNDVFYLYSDGYQDQVGGTENKRFLSQNFRKLLLKIHKEPFEVQKEILDTTIENWRADAGQVDDILVVGFKTK